MVESIKAGLAGLGGKVAKLAGEVFKVAMEEAGIPSEQRSHGI
jgi:hypothetical protein